MGRDHPGRRARDPSQPADLPPPAAPPSKWKKEPMAFYEHVVISRQDISPQQAEALNDQLKHLIEEGGGTVAKIEYWGLRNLTYRIKKNRKGHYSLLAIDAPAPAVQEIERQPGITAVSAKKQRELAKAIKRARFLALLPYVVK